LHDRVADGARAAADIALAGLVAELRAEGHRPVAAGLVGEPRDLPDADRILANHMLLHSAEGELYRCALTDAAEAIGIPVTCFHPKAVATSGRAGLFAALRKAAGPPFAADHRLAVAVALDALPDY
nr:hypothetical protein [Acidimicrobiia bacterium]